MKARMASAWCRQKLGTVYAVMEMRIDGHTILKYLCEKGVRRGRTKEAVKGVCIEKATDDSGHNLDGVSSPDKV